MSLPNKSFNDIATDAAISSAATKWGLGGGAVTSMYGWLTNNGSAVLIGILVTVFGFLVNYVYQVKRDRREIEKHDFERELALAEERRKQELHEMQIQLLIDQQDTSCQQK